MFANKERRVCDLDFSRTIFRVADLSSFSHIPYGKLKGPVPVKGKDKTPR